MSWFTKSKVAQETELKRSRTSHVQAMEFWVDSFRVALNYMIDEELSLEKNLDRVRQVAELADAALNELEMRWPRE